MFISYLVKIQSFFLLLLMLFNCSGSSSGSDSEDDTEKLDPPRVVSILPTSGNLEVCSNEILEITFSDNIDYSQKGIVKFYNPDTTFYGSEIVIQNNKVYIIPAEGLTAGQYESILISGFKGANGVDIIDYSDENYFFNVIDEEKLIIKDIDPSDNSTNVSIDKVIKITFSNEVSNKDEGTVKITPTIDFVKSWVGNTLQLSHSDNFSYDTNYSLEISGFKSNGLQDSDSKNYYFKTEEDNSTKLSIASTDPSDGLTGVSIDKEIKVVFTSEVSNKTGGAVEISPTINFTQNWSGTTLTIASSNDLLKNTTYSLKISGYSASGYTTMDDYSFSFTTTGASPVVEDYYGTLEPFAETPIYFLLTDRFDNGDSSNDYTSQGSASGWGTWDRPLSNGGNIGYLGGDFKGIHQNIDYIKSMGFGAVWISPIIDNPDEAFSGGSDNYPATSNDKGKTGFHGYWGDNFYKVDEHWPSSGYSFKEFTEKMHNDGMKVVLDIVCNHANPGFSMESSQYDRSKYGKLYDENGTLVAESNNQTNNHEWFNGNDQLAQLLDFNPNNDNVQDYLVNAFLKWIGEGADAFRIDTLKHMPMSFWKDFSDRIRNKYPDFYMFGEAWSSDAYFLGTFQDEENGAISVLDFPCKDAMGGVFSGGDYSNLASYLHLNDGIYENPYELVTFYDNHDMARQSWSDDGFIDANNWLFTTRGVPCIYYGSEMGFERGKAEHCGNRNYYGSTKISAAKNHSIYKALCKIGEVRNKSIALQKGLQVNISLSSSTATFLRVYQYNGVNQTALVMLNKGSAAATISVEKYISTGEWIDAETGSAMSVTGSISASVPAHGFKVYLFDNPVSDSNLKSKCSSMMNGTSSQVKMDPEEPNAGDQVTIYYSGNSGDTVLLHWGIDFWGGDINVDGGEFIDNVTMTWDDSEDAFKCTITIPSGALQLDYGFLVNGGWVGGSTGSGWHIKL